MLTMRNAIAFRIGTFRCPNADKAVEQTDRYTSPQEICLFKEVESMAPPISDLRRINTY